MGRIYFKPEDVETLQTVEYEGEVHPESIPKRVRNRLIRNGLLTYSWVTITEEGVERLRKIEEDCPVELLLLEERNQ